MSLPCHAAPHPWTHPGRTPDRVELAKQRSASTRALREAFNERDASSGLHGFRVTHKLVDATEGTLGELYCFRGQYHTREQWTHGEPGITRKDLREGESLVRV